MALLKFAYTAFLVFTAVRFEIFLKRKFHTFMNIPFPEQRAHYPETFDFLDKYGGRFDIAYLRYGGLTRQRPLHPLHQ